ncbi:MAG: hypothetical protein JNK46_07250 [Methylobacteriaceae bacterium]|nr:hypothetical protein [Methylobacteriaceae bacterium]
MSRTSTIFIAAMSIAGLLLGLFTAVLPASGPGTSMAALLLLGVAGLIDVAAMRGLFGLVRLSHGLRFGGLLSGFTLYLIVVVASIMARSGPAAA